MPVLYHFLNMLLFSCSAAVVVTLIFVVLTRKKKFETLTPILGVLQLTFVIALILFYFLAPRLQISIALPYIQQALNEQCETEGIVADEDGFEADSGFRWKSEEIECYFNYKVWRCYC
ncbi:MAG: hypothetical protein HZC41_15115 [Chloroflexi bacterium]|nr:hypothetical protein [Chloroflexota bacterium]